jgi:hypothetical protein
MEVFMKTILFAVMLFIGSSAFAETPPSVVGEWNLVSRICTSNTPTNDGFRVGPDKIGVTFNYDQTFELRKTVAGCETVIHGTYLVDGMKIGFSATSSQSCKETSPQPMVDSYSMYLAHQSDNEIVLVATGDKAAACPAGDALVLDYVRVPGASH